MQIWNKSKVQPRLLSIPQGADFKNNKTTKPESHQEYYCFLVVQFYLDQQKGRKKYFTYYLLVEMKLYIKKTIIYLMRFLFRCFIVFLNPLPGVWAGVEAGLWFISYLQLLINHSLSSPLLYKNLKKNRYDWETCVCVCGGGGSSPSLGDRRVDLIDKCNISSISKPNILV